MLTDDGWYHTSDAGFIDASGHPRSSTGEGRGPPQGGANDGAMF